jgi:hypothetical protein
MGKYLNYFVLTIEGDGHNVCSYTYHDSVVAENYWISKLLRDKLIIEKWNGLGPTDKFKNEESLRNWYNSLVEFDNVIYFPPYEEEDV